MSRSGNLPRLLHGADPGLDSPDVLRMQPMPKSLHVAHMPVPGGGYVTAVMRGWDGNDVGRCRLCPECRVNPAHSCLVVVDRYVEPRDAALLDIRGHVSTPEPRSGGRGCRR